MTRTRSRMALVALVAVVAAACGGSEPERTAPNTTATPDATAITPTTAGADRAAGGGECGRTTGPPSTYQHVVWIFMENHSYDEVIGNAAAPFETGLARRCGTATRYAHVGKPSLPNYIGATSGDTQGVTDNDPPKSHPLTVDNLFRQVRASGRQARSYQEDMPTNCALGSKGTYAVKHNPAPYYVGADDRTACQADNLPLGTLDAGPLADALARDTLPAFTLITPNLCNDTHDCPVATGDKWLERWIPRFIASAGYQSGTTAIFVMWDESTPMPSIIASPSTRPGTVSDTPFDHYSLLRTAEEMLGIPALLGRAAQATSMRPTFGL